MEHIAIVQIVDRIVNDFIGDKAIPDLVIDILGQNSRYEDVSLYSV